MKFIFAPFRLIFAVFMFLPLAWCDVPTIGWKQHFKNAVNFVKHGA
ncbi:MAG TPA: hypothetical protein VFM18_17955 [Methanosarcina sp.]|nr:hypothetical protein [Methanosarcina sp.]